MNKKAFFFSFLALILLFVMVLATQPTSYSTEADQQQFVQNRIIVTNNMIYNFRQGFMSNVVQFEGYAALEALALYRNRTGTLYPSRTALENDFENAMLFGNVTTPTGNKSLSSMGFGNIMPSVSLIDLLQNYSALAYSANKINFTFSRNANDYDIKLYQDNSTGPFAIGVNITVHYHVDAGVDENNQSIAFWNITDSIPVIIPITGLSDPYMMVHSQGNMSYRINQFYTEKWGYPTFVQFSKSGEYIYNNRSWSYLGRFYDGKDFQNCCGILTMVNKTEYGKFHYGNTNQYKNTSFVDCEYFSYASSLISCRDPKNSLVYGVNGISGLSYPSDYPLTITAKFAVETFNLSFSTDLFDTYCKLSPTPAGC